MKNQYVFILLLAIMNSVGQAEVRLDKYQNTIQEIQALEQGKNYQSAAITAAMTANEIADGVGIDQVVKSIDDTLTEERQEVVTERDRQGGSFSVLFGLFSGSAHRNWDVAKIVTTNPDEVAQFDQRKAGDFEKLQKELRSYFKENELPLFYAKVMAAKALQLTANLSGDALTSTSAVVNRTAQRLAQVSFLGVQTISSCVTTNYARRSSGSDLSISGLLFSFGYSESKKQQAYSETSCSSESKTAGVSEMEIISGKLILADMELKNEFQALSLHQLTTTSAPDFPTWGSPSFSN